MKPKTHNKTKKIRGGRKQTGGFLGGLFGTPTTSDQQSEPASSKPWWKFWESSNTNETVNQVVPKEEKAEDSPTKTEEQPDPKSKLADYNGGRRRKIRRQRRTKKRSKSKSKSKAKTT